MFLPIFSIFSSLVLIPHPPSKNSSNQISLKAIGYKTSWKVDIQTYYLSDLNLNYSTPCSSWSSHHRNLAFSQHAGHTPILGFFTCSSLYLKHALQIPIWLNCSPLSSTFFQMTPSQRDLAYTVYLK